MPERKLPRRKIQKNPNPKQRQYPHNTPDPKRPISAHRQWYSHSHNEQKRRENKICRSDPIPFRMIEPPWRMRTGVVDQDHAEHCQAAKDVQ